MAKNDDGEKTKRETPGLSKKAADDVKREVLSGVGYGRPPEHMRFKKGQSGNPKGRPRHRDAGLSGSPVLHELIRKENERLVTIREGDELRQMSTFELTLRAETKSAASGNAYAQKHKIERGIQADGERGAENTAFAERAKHYVAVCREEITEAERRGEPPPTRLPHPDDIIIEDNRVRCVGPINKAELAKLEETIKVRDILIMQDALDHRLANDSEGDDPPGTALLFAKILDNGVPARFRLSKAEWTERMARYGRMPERELLKAVYRAWKELRRPVNRGRESPALTWGEQQIEEAAPVLGQISSDREGA